MTAGELLSFHKEQFYGALLSQDYEALATLYAGNYTLVRPDGSLLSKKEVLRDLKHSGLRFTSIDLREERVQIYGGACIITGDSRTTFLKDGHAGSSRFRMVAVYVEIAGRLKLMYFQGTSLQQSDQDYGTTERGESNRNAN